MQQQQAQKATYTALIISPPQDKWSKIQEIRKIHDKAYERWMPHINVCFPFVLPNEFTDFVKKFEDDFANIQPFNISFKKFQSFNHGKNSVMYLEPETSDQGQSIQNILKTVLAKRPDLDDQNKKSDKGYTPHLTCGTFPTASIDGTIKKYQGKWEEINFRVEELYLIQRGPDTPFEVSNRIRLGSPEDDF